MSPGPGAALDEVRRRIERACRRASRDPATARLIAVSKSFPAERVREALRCGQTLFGENRVQEAQAKASEVGSGAVWHLIGPLQRNKARHAVGLFEMIHSLDSEKLALELDRRAGAAGLRQQVLIQLNLAGEATKSGIAEDDLEQLVEVVAGMEHLDLRGLMTIPPPMDDPEHARVWFAKLRRLRDRAADRSGLVLSELSMGMTDDFEVAVEEGATLVRVGRAIFGERP